jgi:hypothetical protein
LAIQVANKGYGVAISYATCAMQDYKKKILIFSDYLDFYFYALANQWLLRVVQLATIFLV